MRTSFPPLLALLGSLALAASLHAADLRSDVVRKTFEPGPGGRLALEADQGSITIEGHDSRAVEIEVERRVTRGSDSDAAELIRQHAVRISQNGNEIRVECERQDRGRRRWSWRAPQLEVRIRVLLPRKFDVEAETAGGSVTIGRIEGEVEAKTSGGSMRFQEITGNLHGRTSGGSIRASKVTGEVRLNTSGGSVEVEEMKGGRLEVSTAGGSIRLARIDAPATARTSGGGIFVETSVTPLKATTSGGSIEARVTSTLEGTVELKSSAGGISLSLPEDARFDLDASTSAGGVHSEFPVSVRDSGEDRSSLRGPVNGGGPRVSLRTSAGSIRIRRSS
jgi:DUF4097 and DUF4098 domain-containing protein YvlB